MLHLVAVLVEHICYRCPACHAKGHLTDLLVNPGEFLVIKGECPSCGVRSNYMLIDLQKLAREHAADNAVYSAAEGLLPVH